MRIQDWPCRFVQDYHDMLHLADLGHVPVQDAKISHGGFFQSKYF